MRMSTQATGIAEINGMPLAQIATRNGIPLASIAAVNGMPVSIGVLRNFALRRDGPFFALVLTYLVASAGLTPVYDAINYSDFLKGVRGRFPGAVQGAVEQNLAECVALARDGTSLPQQAAEIRLCCMLANTAYESIDKSARDRLKGHQTFEFFRHVRNAASHGNKWHFLPKEPSRTAAWHPQGGSLLELDSSLKGGANPLQGQQCFYGTLQPADLLYRCKTLNAC